MPQYIIRATRDGKTVREDVFESTGMEVALAHAKHVWHDIGPVAWLALHAGDYPHVVARITGKPWTYGPGDGRHHGRLFIRAGEFRAPRKGEFYLSGAIPQAWEAPNDLSTAYHILREAKLGPPSVIPI